LITGLQRAGAELSDKLALLAGRESKHFNIFAASFLLLLVVTAAIYFYQQNQFDVTDTKITSLQQAQAETSSITDGSLTALEDKIDQLNTSMLQEMDKEVALIDDKLKNIQDEVQSVEARFSNDSPFSQIGNDNIIHGAQWINALPAQNFTVQLAFVDTKNAMYELAQYYNTYLRDSLSYFEVADKGITKYVLLSGNYATQQQASAKIESMPRYIDMQKPVVRKLDDIQRYISQ
jgi:hypothetical protein